MTILTQSEIHALNEALDDEYRAWATYNQIIADFGDVRPFSNIRNAEAQHIDALTSLLKQFDLPVPHNIWVGRVEHYADLNEACQAAVIAEIENGKMYERLISTTHQPAILRVLLQLQEASQQRHLPALKRSLIGNSVTCGHAVGRQRRRRSGD